MDHANLPIFGAAESENARALIELAIAEDLGAGGDVTSAATIPNHATCLLYTSDAADE